MALLDEQGQGTVWDLVEGREIGRPKLPAYSDLRGIQALLLDGQIVILPKRRIARPTSRARASLPARRYHSYGRWRKSAPPRSVAKLS